MSQRLCTLSDLPNPGCREFQIVIGQRAVSIFVVRTDQGIFAYLNNCPHTGVTLNWQPNDFLTVGHDYIQCSTHGALFRIEDGYCVWGPCARQSLTALLVEVRGDEVAIHI